MSILTFSDLSKEFMGEYIFNNLSGAIESESTIGIVGPNGIGKTTLLRLISGKLESSGGIISRSRGLKIGYLQQEAIDAFAEKNNSVFEEMRTVFSHLITRREKLSQLEYEMSDGGDTEELLEQYGRELEAFETAGGYEYELNIEKTLEGLGFSSSEWNMPLTHCSGGQKTRALLGRLILEEPDLLIMDEPTNHLDAKAVEWLEGKLIRWDKALIVVSHDRYFLDHIAKQIWEMNIYGFEKFKGNYTSYIMQREERRIRRQKTFDATMEFFYKEMDYIRRFIDKKTTQAKGRMKRLVRQVKAVEIGGPEALDRGWNDFLLSINSDKMCGGISGSKWSVNDTERHIRALKCQNPYTKPMKMRIRCTDHFPKEVLKVRDITVGYGESILFSMEKGDIFNQNRIALLGPNGCGKSTFLKAILGEISVLEGKLHLGESIKIAYYAQSHDILNPENTVVEELMSHKQGLLEAEARNFLGQYLFSGDDVFKFTENLSGGERGRLTLAILALKEVNFLILDEPTNHLDIQSREILEDALEHFQGTILFVTHDRYLINQLATHIWNIDDNKIIPFRGSYEAYQKMQSEIVVPVTESVRKEKPRMKTVNPEKELQLTEEKIINLENELKILSKNMETAVENRNQHKIKDWNESYLQSKNEIQYLLHRWEDLSIS